MSPVIAHPCCLPRSLEMPADESIKLIELLLELLQHSAGVGQQQITAGNGLSDLRHLWQERGWAGRKAVKRWALRTIIRGGE